MKGAPPKLRYLEKLFPYLRSVGATGLLIEYEDSFPFWGELGVLAAPHAYTRDEIECLLASAAASDLEVIPLIQTFGHLEFALKHDKFISLREVPRYPNVLCPCLPASMKFVRQMISQILQLHPHVHFIHIGCDEVWHLGICSRCQERLEVKQWSRDRLFIDHVSSVVQAVRFEKSDISVLAWDDMLRPVGVAQLRGWGIGEQIEPMVWHYLSTGFDLPSDLWDKYAEVFPHIWVASAFKGASGAAQCLPDIQHHIRNHLNWLRTMSVHANKFHSMQGFALTGWQRYDHYAILCELLPASIPSLVVCLQTLLVGDFNEQVHCTSSKLLGSPYNIDLDIGPRPHPIQTTFSFPGCDVFVTVNDLVNQHSLLLRLKTSQSFHGWFSPFNISRCYANPLQIEIIHSEVQDLRDNFRRLREQLRCHLEVMFGERTIDEWLAEHVDPSLQQSQQILSDAQLLLEIGAKPQPRSATGDIIMHDAH